MSQEIHFYKYQGAGNDFILLDNRKDQYASLSFKQIARLCDRRFGIGADGLMMLGTHATYPFYMSYFNSDGLPGSMCGNGGRCICAFAHELGLVENKIKFWASDGEHEANLVSNLNGNHIIRLKMRDVPNYYRSGSKIYIIDSGSPHYISFVEDTEKIELINVGRKIRFSKDFPQGINVNFVQISDSGLTVRTYERGVEDETYSCGTGVTASAMAYLLETNAKVGSHHINVYTKGGHLQVELTLKKNKVEPLKNHSNLLKASCSNLNLNSMPKTFLNYTNKRFEDVYLEGLATFVFEGNIILYE
ncbi:MAG: diaminopimelate epimerase [Bacteroidales bacterium]